MNRSRLLSSLLFAAALVGCGSNVRLDETPAGIENRTGGGSRAVGPQSGATTSGVDAAGSDRTVAPIVAEQGKAVDPLNAPDSLLSQREVFFAYDSFLVEEQYRPLVEAHARYLVEHPERRVVLQGNTDERGSREYNLALGQKRAEAVRRAMSVLGVRDNQIEAVSFGEERPRAVSQTDEAYTENRRVDIVYQ